MTEGGVTRPKRINTRFFKNPPQPYMCIRDSLMGSPDPCYVNVLSWDKVGFHNVFTNDVPLYGGMKLHPPRTEKKEVSVFAVMAHPEVLKQHGKNTHNPQERTWLIDTLLDFVEKMNSGVVFNRRYRVLHDRDITGELKAIWMAVQMQRIEQIERTTYQIETDSEDVQQPVSSYSQCEEQQQQKQNSMQQSQKHSTQEHQPQQEQEKQQQQQQQLQLQQRPQQLQQRQDYTQEQLTQQPPQYHPRVDMDRGGQDTTNDRRARSRYGHPKQPNRTNEGPFFPTNKHPQAPSSHNDHHVSHDHYSPPNFQDQQRQTHPDEEYTPQPPQYHSSVHYAYDRQDSNRDRRARLHSAFYSATNKYPPIQSGNDQYRFHDPSTTPSPQAQQQNCLPYQAYQYQTLPRPMGQPFLPNAPPNPSMNNASTHNPSVSCVNFARSEPIVGCNKFPTNREAPETIDRKPLQPHQHHQAQHPQATHVQLVHSSTVNYYDSQNSSLPTVVMLRPEESNGATRQNAPATHVTRTRITSNVVSLLQPHFATLTTAIRTNPTNLTSVASTIVAQTPNDRSSERSVTIIGRCSDDETTQRCESLQLHAGAQATCDNNSAQVDKRKSDKISKIKVLKRDKSSDKVEVAVGETKTSTNGDVERVRIDREKNRVFEDKGNVDDRLVATNCEKNGSANEDRSNDSEISAKTTTTTSNASAKSVVEIVTAGENDGDDCSSRKKTNGQIVTSKSAKDSNDEVSQVYTILRKPEASQDHMTSDVSQLSINESSRADKLTKSGDTGGGRLRRRR